jgi:hypothetical protein
VDSDSIIQKIRHGNFDIPTKEGTQIPLTVEFPDFKGALGLCAAIPRQGCLISTISLSEENAIATGWTNVIDLILTDNTTW